MMNKKLAYEDLKKSIKVKDELLKHHQEWVGSLSDWVQQLQNINTEYHWVILKQKTKIKTLTKKLRELKPKPQKVIKRKKKK